MALPRRGSYTRGDRGKQAHRQVHCGRIQSEGEAPVTSSWARASPVHSARSYHIPQAATLTASSLWPGSGVWGDLPKATHGQMAEQGCEPRSTPNPKSFSPAVWPGDDFLGEVT